MSAVTITDADFETFREFFYRRTGISFQASKRYFVDKRLVERIRSTSSPSFRAYFTMLRAQSSGLELQALVNAMTVNETYFFREAYQFDCLVESMLPELVRRKTSREPIRIWVVPSSSGEEAYSIAMCLLERWPALQTWDVQIVSSDIDTERVEAARAGLYSARSVQHVPPAYLAKYFVRTSQGYQINDVLRGAVEFTRVNLMEPEDVRPHRNLDVVFCRNLLIYFDDLSRRQAVETLFDAMNPGGFICLGHSESMSRISSLFTVRAFPSATVHQRPLEVT